MDINDRVKALRCELNLSQSEFGKKLGLERSSLSLIERKQRNVTDRVVRDICREYNVAYGWLKDGEGDMFLPDEMDTTAMFDRIMAGENEIAKAIFRAFAKLEDEDWLVIKKLIDEIKK